MYTLDSTAMSSEPLRIATTFVFEPEEVFHMKSTRLKRPVEIFFARSEAEFRANLAGAEVIFGSCRGSDLALAHQLRWIQLSSAGVDTLDPEFWDSNIVLTNYAAAFAPAIAETAFALLLSL